MIYFERAIIELNENVLTNTLRRKWGVVRRRRTVVASQLPKLNESALAHCLQCAIEGSEPSVRCRGEDVLAQDVPRRLLEFDFAAAHGQYVPVEPNGFGLIRRY